MGKSIFDFDKGRFFYATSDDTATDFDNCRLLRMSNNMAMDMESGELHIVSSWPNDEEDE